MVGHCLAERYNGRQQKYYELQLIILLWVFELKTFAISSTNNVTLSTQWRSTGESLAWCAPLGVQRSRHNVSGLHWATAAASHQKQTDAYICGKTTHTGFVSPVHFSRVIPSYSKIGWSPKVNSENYCGRISTDCILFLSPNEQHQSTEGWQCYRLRKACCQGRPGTVWRLCGLFCPPASRVHPSCDSNSVPDSETSCYHHAVMVSQEHSCGTTFYRPDALRTTLVSEWVEFNVPLGT